MPINTNSAVSREIKQLVFTDNNTIRVTLSVAYDGVVRDQEVYDIAPEHATQMIDVAPPEGFTLRQAIVLSVYTYLIENNIVPGTMG